MSRDTPLQPDLDRAIEAGLRHQARSEPCPTMDVIAAYCEHSLAVEELTRWEDHFAGCRRCQQVLASVARVEPVLPPVSAPSWSWRALDWRWLVPATAAAAAVTIWIAVRPAPSTVEGPAPSRAVPAITPPQVVAQRSEPAAEPQPPAAAAPAPSVVAAPVSQRPQELLSKPTEQAMPPPLAPAGRAVASAAPVGQTAGGVPETAPPPPAGQVETKALANRVDLAAADVARERETGAVIVSPGSQIRWRLGARGEIGRSEDGGVTWAVQNAGTSQELLAGSAPSDDVLWVVGRGGTILKTTDGRSWSRIDSPVPDDVVSVEATDAATATIRTADGQRYVTRDGGKSWERQEH